MSSLFFMCASIKSGITQFPLGPYVFNNFIYRTILMSFSPYAVIQHNHIPILYIMFVLPALTTCPSGQENLQIALHNTPNTGTCVNATWIRNLQYRLSSLISATLRLSRDYLVVSGGQNRCTRSKPPPNPNSLATFLHVSAEQWSYEYVCDIYTHYCVKHMRLIVKKGWHGTILNVVGYHNGSETFLNKNNYTC